MVPVTDSKAVTAYDSLEPVSSSQMDGWLKVAMQDPSTKVHVDQGKVGGRERSSSICHTKYTLDDGAS